MCHLENVLLLGNSGTGKTHLALAMGLAACQQGHRVRFTTTAALVSELIEARDEKKLLHLQKQIASYEFLIVDELGFVPLSKTGAELLFEMLSQRYERGSTLITSNLPFQEWTEVLGSERLIGALLDRLTHHVHILEMNGDSYRLKQSKHRPRADDHPPIPPKPDQETQESPRAGAFLRLLLMHFCSGVLRYFHSGVDIRPPGCRRSSERSFHRAAGLDSRYRSPDVPGRKPHTRIEEPRQIHVR